MKVNLSLIIIGVFLCGIDETVGDVRSSLTFVIDDTGSMGDDIKMVKQGVNDIFDTVMRSNSSQIEDFVLVTFNDPENLNKLRARTKDRNVFKNALSSIDVGGGGLCPETSMAGIKLGLQNSREGSIIYVFTDASARDFDKYDEVEALSQKMGCQIVFVLTGYCYDKTAPQYLVYKQLAYATFGQVFHLEEKNEIGQILKYVENSIESRKNVLASKTFPAGYGNTLKVPVDADMKELVISVAGLRPSVKVTDSEGKEWDPIVMTDLPETLAVKVVGVTPDEYTVEVGSKEETRVVVSGDTTVHFQHGFSTVSPTSINDTVKRPVPGVKSHLSIKLSSEGGNVQLRSVQILDMDDEVILETPLELVDKSEQFYTTELIKPPDHQFKVAIIGYDKNTNTLIKRVSLTPVKPQASKPASKSKAPTVDCMPKVTAAFEKSLQLKCTVSGSPRPDVIWESDDKSAVFSHFESTIELPYDYISVLDIKNVKKNATYTCKAVNSKGHGENRVTVQVKRKNFFNVLASPKDAIIEYKKSFKIPCNVEAYPPATVSWLRDLRPLKSDRNMEVSADGSLTIRSMEPSMAGNYICEARNAVQRKIFRFRLDISGWEAPEINKNNGLITVAKDSRVEIRCQVTKGKPKPKIDWYYKNGASEMERLDVTTDTIHFDKVDADNAGSYRCIADNGAGWDIHEIDLIVEDKPSISRPYESVVTASLGETVTLECPAVGEPAPTITWKLNGRPLSSTARHSKFADGTLMFLATTVDEGDYECEASNPRGVDKINYNLHIYVPVDIESPRNSFIEQMEGSKVTLPCRADGSPKPSITWIYRSKDPAVRPSRLEPSDASGRLNFDRILPKHSGEYTCVATNSRGSKNITYEVSVLAPPTIHYMTKDYHGVVGDLSLQIPCNATGNPKPDITWSIRGYNIASGSAWYDISAEGTLIIKNIDKMSAGVYTCKASNTFGQRQEYFNVVVDVFPDPKLPIKEITLKRGQSATIPCAVPQKKTDKLLWFKDGRLLPYTDVTLYDVTESHSGTYTCRVSSVDHPAQTGSTRVEVGFEPSFQYPDDPKDIPFEAGGIATMDCTANGAPKPEVKWYHNDMEISLKEYKYDLDMNNDYDKGRYTCVVSNSFGTVQQEFVVSSFECVLDVNHDFDKNEPLMLTNYNKVPNFKTSGGLLRIPKDETIKFVCPSTFHKIPAREITVTCENDKRFFHPSSGRRFAYSDLKCRDKWQPTVTRTKRSCTHRNSEILNVGFETGRTFLTVYEVCYDRDSNNPIYTKLDMQPSLPNVIANNSTEWFDYGSHVDLDGLYDCSNQNAETSAILNKEFHRGDGCCFAKRTLVNPLDVAPVLQGGTFTHLNVAPHWGTCNSKNWEEVERRIRNLVVSSDRTLQVFTGTAYNLQLPDAYLRQKDVVLHSRGKDVQVPRYLWKVVQDPATDASLAIIQVNVPDLSLANAHSYQLCRDVCKNAEWMHTTGRSRWRNVNHGFTYCCSLSEFERVFRYHGVFPDHRNQLLEVSDVPDDHYLHAA